MTKNKIVSVLFIYFSFLGVVLAQETEKIIKHSSAVFSRLMDASTLKAGKLDEFFKDPALSKISAEDKRYLQQCILHQRPNSKASWKLESSKIHLDFGAKKYVVDFASFSAQNPNISINGSDYSLDILVNGALSGNSKIKAQLSDLQKWHNNQFQAQVPLWLQILLSPLSMAGCTPKNAGSAEAALGGAALNDALAPPESEAPRGRSLAPNSHGAPSLEAPADTETTPASSISSTSSPLSSDQRTKLINYIAQKEFSGNWRNSVGWNTKESFPSLGLGHYIWYPAGKRGPFDESFPQFIKFAKEKNPNLKFPETLKVDANGNIPPAPWATKSAFQSAKDSGQLDPLIQFLQRDDIKQLQLDFQMAKLNEFSTQLGTAKEKQLLNELKSTPNGLALLVHYRIFKGDGMTASERYTHDGKSHGWGLKQVLEHAAASANSGSAIDKVKQSAITLLTNRAKHDRTTLNVDEATRQKYIQSWTSAVSGYGSIL